MKLRSLLAVICLAALATARAQVTYDTNQIRGTVRFSNVNPAILSLLDSPGNEGMSNVYISASSVPPAATRYAADYFAASSLLSSSYRLAVDADGTGIAYGVSPRVSMLGEKAAYYFLNRTSAPVVIGGPPATVDFAECVGVVTVRFTSGGMPVSVDGGTINAFGVPVAFYTGQHHAIPAGVTEQRIYLRGGETHRLDITIHRGTSFYTDRIQYSLTTNVAVTCDALTTIEMALPTAGSLGKITGNVDLLREFELTIEGNDFFLYPDYTTVIANYGPFSNQRWDALPGMNFTTPSSGSFGLENVVPSTVDPASRGYVMYAQMIIRTNERVQYFRSPAMGWGSNPALVVSPGANIDLANTFVIDPGYLRGRVFLQGPAESLGRPSLLRGVQHAHHGDLDGDGIPDAVGTYGVYWTTIGAEGVDRPATGATRTAAFGYGNADFRAAFNPVNSAYEGDYELVLGGMNSERTLWKRKYLSLTLSSGTVSSLNDYYFNVYSVTDRTTNDVEVVPSQPVTSDVTYCFSEVCLVYRSTNGTFYNPQIRGSAGSFVGTDFQGRPADYYVSLDLLAGTPNSQVTASNIGQVVMYLPQGTYRFYPSVTPSNSIFGVTGLEPIDITIGCGQRICLEPCLQLRLNAPACAPTNRITISGSVLSCSNNVTRITYRLNSGPTQTVCTACGPNPTFSFPITLGAECSENSLVVEAHDAFGGLSSVSTSIRFDATPPVLTCPTNIVTSCSGTNGQVVNFTVSATDNCPGNVNIVCSPPSGSLFPVGVTAVTCTATDVCGNTSVCRFDVTVNGAELMIERAICVRWNCPGTLQGSDNIAGPWSDIVGATSPYYVPVSAARRFYRTRN